MLQAISGSASLAGYEIPSDSTAHEYLGDIEAAVARASELTWHLRAFSEGGDPVTEATDISRLVDDTVRVMRSTVGAKVRLHLDLEAGLPNVQCDPD